MTFTTGGSQGPHAGKERTAMKQVLKKVNISGVILLLGLADSCTTTTQTQNKENRLIAAGSK
jgi:hypothetical protein